MKFPGPIFLFELRRSAKRPHFFLFRVIVGFFLLGLLIYSLYTLEQKLRKTSHIRYYNPLAPAQSGSGDAGQVRRGGSKTPPPAVPMITSQEWNGEDQKQFLSNSMSEFTSSFCFTILTALFAIVLIMTPMVVVGAMTEEFNRRTIDFLLASDLTDSEIIFGKFGSRVLEMALLLLVPVPIIFILEFFGGIPTSLVAFGFFFAISIVFSLGALTVYLSVHLRNWNQAVMRVNLFSLLYFVLLPILINNLGDSNHLTSAMCGNPWLCHQYLEQHLASIGTIDDVLPSLTALSICFHGLLTLLLVSWSLRGLRTSRESAIRIPLWQKLRGMIITRFLALEHEERERVELTDDIHPVYWKEIPAGYRARKNWGRLIMMTMLLCLGIFLILLPFVVIKNYDVYQAFEVRWMRSGQWPMMVCLFFYGIIASLLLLSIAFRGAMIINTEREKDTWVTLVSSGFRHSSIFWHKFLAIFYPLNELRAWLIIAVIPWTMSMWNIPLSLGLLATLASYLLLIATLSMLFTVSCESTFQSLIRAVVCALILAGLPLGFFSIFDCVRLGFDILHLEYSNQSVGRYMESSFMFMVTRIIIAVVIVFVAVLLYGLAEFIFLRSCHQMHSRKDGKDAV